MSDINYDKFKNSLKRLEERYNDYKVSCNRVDLLPSDRESIKESCIQRFEVCFDTAWKHLKKYLAEEVGLLDVPEGPKPLFRKAFTNKTIEDAELWIAFNTKRGDTSHDYCGDKADGTFEIIPDFIAEAIDLYETMSGEKWQR